MSGRRATTERSNINYNIYCINFYGSGLNSIKEEFKQQIQGGLRRSVFVLDLQDMQEELNLQPRTTKQRLSYMTNSSQHLMNSVVQAIQNFRKEYDAITKKINDELKFDLYQYWLKDLDDKQKEISLVETASLKSKLSMSMGKPSKTTRASKKFLARKQSVNQTEDTAAETCVPLVMREHNRVGQSEMLSKRKYIKDEPSEGKLSIIIIGQHIDEQFCTDLLRWGQTLQGIVHFLPSESNYDILVNNTKLRNFIMDTLESINDSIYQLRQVESMKSVGLFTYDLPIISSCLATKYQKEIYDQLSWGVYDIEMLQQQYQLYYYKPFQETNVALPPDVDLKQIFKVAESLSVQGQFQKNSLPGVASDWTTILAYVDSLLNNCDLVENNLSVRESAEPELPNLTNLIKEYSSAFESITKIRKYERLFIEDTNQLLTNILQYADQATFRNIHLSCLDYHLWRPYLIDPYLRAPEETSDSFSLPGFIKLYISDDSCRQKISELTSIYPDYDSAELQPGCKLYTFHKTYNVVFEYECLEIIPTRLCFRDFTLFQKSEFLKNLVTPKMREVTKEVAKKENEMKMIDMDDSIYIRPNSLKTLQQWSEKGSGDQSRNSWEKEVRKSRNRSQHYDKKPSVSRRSRLVSEEWVGLPPDHHLIKGYNLEDIRQEVKSKTSKYFYDNGSIQLYEDKWCFQDMNKQLTLTINDSSIYFNRPLHQVQGISNNIRLNTKNNVNIRILNEPKECTRVVMNYPNGMSVYYNENNCEQIWFSEETFRAEQRRIYTPYGAIIVFYKAEHMILIMRYNGEVYKLLQYEFPVEEEEQEMLSEFSDNQSFSFYDDAKAKGDHIDNNTPSSGGISLNGTVPEKVVDLKSLINNELSFLHYISMIYELSYLHLVVTTSQGRRINLTPEGKIFEVKPWKIEEWHDYFANESYCLRSDGVKMIWTQDALKCYHKDGSVFTTKTEEGFQTLDVDVFESQISQSSSHGQMEGTEESVNKSQAESTIFIKDFSTPVQTEKSNYSDYLATEGAEEHVKEDSRYLRYACSSWLMLHPNYAGVYFLWFNTLSPTPASCFMEILGIDNIIIDTVIQNESETESRCWGEDLTNESSSKDKDNNYLDGGKLLVNVRIGDNLHLTVYQESLEIYAIMERHTDSMEESNFVCDSLTLSVLYKNSLTDVFKYLVNEIATFQNYNGQKTEDIYFVERNGQDCKVKGFEFLDCLPKIANYEHLSSNCLLEVKPVKNIMELMTHSYPWFEKDMKKFPRFHIYKARKSFTEEPDFPMVCSTSIYCKLPPALQNTEGFKIFVEPLENINFKKLRHKIKDLLDIHLKPKLQIDVKRLYSFNSWCKRHHDHEKRKLKEQQRSGLYHAILKHRMYPNYFKFTKNYEGHVCHIDFFDFMQFQCENKEVNKEEVFWQLQNEGRNSNIKRSRSGVRKPKCKYGNYDN